MHDLLMAAQINFNDLPAWQKRGVGVYRIKVVKTGSDSRTGLAVETTRNVLKVDMELPMSCHESPVGAVCNRDG